MKKGSLIPLILCLLLSVSLVGCSSSSKDTSNKTSKSNKAVSASSKTESAQASNKASVQAPSAKKEIQSGQAASIRVIGQIVSIKDRTITLALLEIPSPPDNGVKPSAPRSGNYQGSPPTSGATPPAGNQPGGQTPQLSGEKKTITIPASLKIVSGAGGNPTEVNISTLKAGQLMEVKLNSSTGAVEAVQVMEAGQGRAPARDTAPKNSSSNQ